jgi:hypothetical protein
VTVRKVDLTSATGRGFQATPFVDRERQDPLRGVGCGAGNDRHLRFRGGTLDARRASHRETRRGTVRRAPCIWVNDFLPRLADDLPVVNRSLVAKHHPRTTCYFKIILLSLAFAN